MTTTVGDRAVAARGAVSALFFVNGFVFANVVPRYPEIKADLALSNAAFGTAVAAMPLGALLLGLLASPLIRRFGSGPTAVVSLALMGANVVLIGTAPSYLLLCAALFMAGSLDAVTDVAMNAHGLRVQRLYGRSINNAFHGIWSVGAVLGGLAGAGAAQAALPLRWHLGATAVLAVAATLAASRFLLPGAEDTERAPADDGAARSRPRPGWAVARTLAALGLVAASAAVIEDSGATWGAVYLQTELMAIPLVGGLAFAALQGMQTVGRLLGDLVVRRIGYRATARLGGSLVTVGMGVALLWPSVPSTIAGFGCAGLGIATLIPSAYHAADEIPGLWPGAGLTVTAFLCRIGFLASPPVVGLIADATSIRLGLLVVPAAGLLVLLSAGVLDAGPAASAAPRAYPPTVIPPAGGPPIAAP